MNIEHRTSNIQHPTSNIQHPTLNIEAEENEDATSSKGSAGVPPAVSRILRGISLTPVGRCGLAAPTFLRKIDRHGADPFAYFEWVFEKLMHNPSSEQHEELLPAHWTKTRPAASQTIESRIA